MITVALMRYGAVGAFILCIYVLFFLNLANEVNHHHYSHPLQLPHDVLTENTHRVIDIALKSVLKRADWSRSACTATPKNQTLQHMHNETLLPKLPEYGVAGAIREWIENTNKTSSRPQNCVCKLPPSKSCHVSNFTIVIMAQDTKRFKKLLTALRDVFPQWTSIGLTEIILVWNAPRSDLERAAATKNANESKVSSKVASYVAQMLEWNVNPDNMFRIFYSLEHNLGNNLLNRYHPSISPKNSAVVYFDDDGPFYTTNSTFMKAGLELWRRNSRVQVGSFGRYLTIHSDGTSQEQQQGLDATTNRHGKFNPLCLGTTGRKVVYNRDKFSDFGSSIILPTGSIIHRNYLCIIWHPAFEELRQFILDHPTHPDDMLVSILIAQLSGKGARQYPRKRYIAKPEGDGNHRRLLWEQPHWFDYRADAVNSILGYFGSLHPGSIGWCQYKNANTLTANNSSVPHMCEPAYPSVKLLPWMNEDTGHDRCTIDENGI